MHFDPLGGDLATSPAAIIQKTADFRGAERPKRKNRSQTSQAKSKATQRASMSVSEIGGFLDLSASAVIALHTRGIITRDADGKYNLRTVLKEYLGHLRNKAAGRGGSGAEAAVRLKIAQAEKVELQNAEARGELIPASKVESEWSAILATVRAAMLAVPSRVQSRLGTLTAHDVEELATEIRAALQEVANDGNT